MTCPKKLKLTKTSSSVARTSCCTHPSSIITSEPMTPNSALPLNCFLWFMESSKIKLTMESFGISNALTKKSVKSFIMAIKLDLNTILLESMSAQMGAASTLKEIAEEDAQLSVSWNFTQFKMVIILMMLSSKLWGLYLLIKKLYRKTPAKMSKKNDFYYSIACIFLFLHFLIV